MWLLCREFLAFSFVGYEKCELWDAIADKNVLNSQPEEQQVVRRTTCPSKYGRTNEPAFYAEVG